MCTIRMNSKELAERVSKYSFTTGHIGGSGCWNYSQIEKSLVTNHDDIVFFTDNQTSVDNWGVISDKKFTFDGTPDMMMGGIYDWSNVWADIANMPAYVENSGSKVANENTFDHLHMWST